MAIVCGCDRKVRRRKSKKRGWQVCVAVTGRGRGREEEEEDGNSVW
jgi:hypothetical protein